ncbi:MAG TPA: carboxypeptidase regulatory-like domain-containing protein, partial [Vicinamibacteria bacterium]
MRPLALLLLLAAAASPAAAAVPASLRVVVRDPSGAAVPGVLVAVAAGEEAREAATDRSGAVVLEGVPLGTATVTASLDGFETQERQVPLRAGANAVEITLPLARRVEDVSVRPDDRASASQGFGSVLTAAEIAALPDDPEELEEALRRLGGPDAVLRVNGFSGGRLPPKSQIREIRFQMNPYSAEFHEAGHGRIDIITKPGLGSWRTGLKSGLRQAGLNARPPLAPEQPADSYRRYGLSLEGPLVKGRTSFSLNVDGRANDGARTIHASLPAGAFSALAPQATDKLDAQVRLEHAWGAARTLRAEYQRLGQDQDGLAAGGLDLAERAYDQHQTDDIFRLSDSGALGKAALETLAEARWSRTSFTPLSRDPAVQVQGAFHAGGAQLEGGRRSASFSLAQNLDWGTKHHALRAGYRLEAEHHDDDEQRNAGGTYVFPDLAAYEAGRPALFTRRRGDARVRFDHLQAGVYLQDEITLGRRAKLSLGLRSEAQSAVDGALHLGPRLGFAYSLTNRTTLRLGAGRFREWLPAAARAETVRLDGRHAFGAAIADPSYPELPAGDGLGDPVATRYLPLESLTLPRIDRVSLGLERTLGDGLRARLDYSFERGREALRTVDRNAPLPGAGRPHPERGNELEVVADGRSRRHIFNTGGGYMKPGAPASFFLGYMFTHARDDGELGSVPPTAAGLRGEWGPALGDVRHRLFGFGRTRLGKGLSASALLRMESGAPYEITTGRDDNGDSIVDDRP